MSTEQYTQIEVSKSLVADLINHFPDVEVHYVANKSLGNQDADKKFMTLNPISFTASMLNNDSVEILMATYHLVIHAKDVLAAEQTRSDIRERYHMFTGELSLGTANAVTVAYCECFTANGDYKDSYYRLPLTMDFTIEFR